MLKVILLAILFPIAALGQGFTFRDPTFNCAAPASGGGSPTTPPTFVTDMTDSGGSYGSISATIAVGSAANRLLVAVIAINSAGQASTVTGVTFNGVAMTDSGEGLVYDGSGNGVAIYYLAAPANTTAALVVSGSQTGLSGITLWCGYFTGAAQSSTLASHASATGNSSTASLTVASGAGQMVVDGTFGVAYATMVAHPNRTGHNYVAGNRLSTSYLLPGVASSVMDWDENASGTWADLAININGL